MTFYAKGKLLLTAEYSVLEGALALAVPTKLGQSLIVNESEDKIIRWKSFDKNGDIWYENSFNKETFMALDSYDSIGKRISQLFIEIEKLNPFCWKKYKGITFETNLEFNRLWGLGSSSTLISILAQWSNVNPFIIQKNVFGGSGYDVACSSAKNPILFQIKNNGNPQISVAKFNPPFKNHLFFIYLNKKQDSQKVVKEFNRSKLSTSKIDKINLLTKAFINAKSLDSFQKIIFQHEDITSKIINKIPIQQELFPDYSGAVKSLGAWGGDFILACGDLNTPRYFKNKGYKTCLNYQSLVFSNK